MDACLQRILSAQRQEGKRTPLEDIYRIAGQIANGMAYLHSKHVVHRYTPLNTQTTLRVHVIESLSR